MHEPAALFELKQADLGYNAKVALRGVSLSIARGERVAVVGKSGAGKTTLLRALYAQRAQDTALVPQDLGLVKTLSVFHNVYMGSLDRRATWYNVLNLVRPLKREVNRIREVVRRLGLEPKLFALVEELSGGQKQRTAIGRAIYRDCRILMGDEPVSALDEQQSRAVLESIHGSHDTVVLAMHDVPLALAYTDRVVGLRDGRIALDERAASMKPNDLDFLYRI